MHAQSHSGYATRMSLFFAGFFFPLGVYIPFFSVWLNSLGMQATEIGLILTIPMIGRVFGTVLMSALADKLGDRRLTLRIYCLAFGLSFALILLNDSLIWIATVIAISSVAQSAVVPIADSLATAGSRRYGLDYSRMRSWGSSAFMVANIVGGLALDTFGASKIIWILVIANLFQFFLALTLPTDPRLIDNKKLTKGTKLNWAQLRQFVQSGFWIILFATSLVQASHGLLYGFGTIYWQEVGISSKMIGVFWSVSVLSEVILFLFYKKFSAKLDWKSLLYIAAIASTIRWFLLPLELSETGYFFLQILHAGSFACSHLGTMFFLAKYVDDELSGTAQGLFSMLVGLSMAIVTFLSGMLYARFAGDAFFIMSIVSLVALLLLLLAKLFPMDHITANVDEPEPSNTPN